MVPLSRDNVWICADDFWLVIAAERLYVPICRSVPLIVPCEPKPSLVLLAILTLGTSMLLLGKLSKTKDNRSTGMAILIAYCPVFGGSEVVHTLAAT